MRGWKRVKCSVVAFFTTLALSLTLPSLAAAQEANAEAAAASEGNANAMSKNATIVVAARNLVPIRIMRKSPSTGSPFRLEQSYVLFIKLPHDLSGEISGIRQF